MKNLRFVLMASVGLIASSTVVAQNVQNCQPLSYSSLDVGGCKIIGQQVFDSRSDEANAIANSVEALKLESRIPSSTRTTNSSAASPSNTSGTSTTTISTVPASPSNPSSTSGTSTTTISTVPASPSNPGSTSGTSTTTISTVPASPSNPSSTSGTSTTTISTVPASPSNPSSTSSTSTTTISTVPASPSNPSSTSSTSTTRVELPVTLPSTPSNPQLSDGPIVAPEAPVVGNNTQEAAIMEQLNAAESKKPYFGNYRRTSEQRVEISTYNRVDVRDTPSSGLQASRVVIERNNNSTGPDYNPDYNPDMPN